MELEPTSPRKPLEKINGVICLEGLIFLDKSIIRAEDPIVTRTFQDLYKHVIYN